MAFGPNSTNPRERRAYADALLAKASGSTEDYEAAKAAVERSGNSTKSQRANFSSRLVAVALRDADTDAIVNLARRTVNEEATPPRDGIGNSRIQLKIQERTSPDFEVFRQGVAIRRGYWQRPADGAVEDFGELTITAHDSNNPHEILLSSHDIVNVDAVRMLPDSERSEIASLATRVV